MKAGIPRSIQREPEWGKFESDYLDARNSVVHLGNFGVIGTTLKEYEEVTEVAINLEKQVHAGRQRYRVLNRIGC